jgi:SNF2 family DNA or RNA helicase
MQMVRMLDILEAYLEQLGHRACRLDGGVSWQDRQQAINDFNTDSVSMC